MFVMFLIVTAVKSLLASIVIACVTVGELTYQIERRRRYAKDDITNPKGKG